jgi:cobyrinic acid a,c-diamide synthase
VSGYTGTASSDAQAAVRDSAPMIRALCVAGLASSVGKTTVTLALAAALRRRGLRVRCAKVGPDFIDPGFHEAVTGAPSRTLDSWMLGPDALRTALARAGAEADVVVVEGAMGLFDGLEGRTEIASTAEVAKLLGLPVILVVDASAQVRSAGALVLGAEQYDPALDLAGVIFNRVGGERHVRWLREALAGRSRARLLGALPWRKEFHLPERHLGLVTARECRFPPHLFESLADAAEASIDIETCLSLAGSRVRAERPPAPRSPRLRLGVALDEAFQFYYPDTLDALRAAGAEVVPWSPLEDARLPDVDALYLGGGYPEVHAARLAENVGARAAVRAFVGSGRPVYAECGGLMYLADRLENLEGDSHRMVGVLPVHVRMRPRRLTLGYREVRLESDGLLGAAGTVLRGHEFHASHLETAPDGIECSYRVVDPTGGDPWSEGYRVGNTLASYIHLCWESRPGTAEAFVTACARIRARPRPATR